MTTWGENNYQYFNETINSSHLLPLKAVAASDSDESDSAGMRSIPAAAAAAGPDAPHRHVDAAG